MERLTIVLPEKFHFTTEMPVLINDINLGNHVGNDAFVRYINEAYWRFSGAFNISRNIILVMMFSGGLAGLAGMSEITGVVHRLQTAISPGYGFTGIIIAWLAKLNPFGVVIVSIFFGALILAGREIQPSGVPKMIQGIILVCLIASDYFMRYHIRLERAGTEG